MSNHSAAMDSTDSPFSAVEHLSKEGAFVPNQSNDLPDSPQKDASVAEAELVGWEGWLETIASDLYRLASMVLGEGEAAVHLVEEVVTELDLSSCGDHAEARRQARLLLAAKAIDLLAARDAAALAAVAAEDGPVSCIEDEDLSSAGLTREELEQMLDGPERPRLRGWLEGLATSLRVIFALRAVAGLSSAVVAGLLNDHGILDANAELYWTPVAVSGTFRQGLCSLASQLLHASAEK